MKEIIDTNEMKAIIFEILKNVAHFCDENNIKYYLAFGTLLGAARHKGFIPWDDDLDIMMPREDYEKFIKIYKSDRYKCVDVTKNKDYFYPFAKVYDTKTIIKEDTMSSSSFGIYIDVFPIDGIPAKRPKAYLRRTVFLQKCLRNKYSPYNRPRGKVKQFLIHITKFLLSPFSLHNIGNKINRLAQRTPYNEAKYVGIIVWGYDYQIYKKELLDKRVKLQFESGEFYVPSRYDALLRLIYGDYLKLPPKSKRVSVHGFKAYYK